MSTRRGFLKLFGGGAAAAATAGPGALARAAAKPLGLDALELGASAMVAHPPPAGPAIFDQPQYALRLAKLMGRTAEQHAFHKRRTDVYRLDPDLAGYHSLALHAKIALQRERNYARELDENKGWLEAALQGWFDEQ